MPHRNRQIMLRVRAEWKRDGICTRCGKRDAAPGSTRCDDCRGYDADRKNALPPAQPQA